MDGTGTLQFHGTDAKECVNFIAAVIKHAYDQGKLRDDEWIADFTATCLANDALRWWIGLDEETQRSWKLLRQAMTSRYQPLFYGKNGEEAEQFVHSVRQRTRDAGKQNDNDWIIAFVSDSFVGNALRWHVSLDSSVRKNWELLEVAILAQYPSEDQSGPLLKMPTPAAAASAPPKTKSRGRIRVSKRNDAMVFYLSKKSNPCGLETTTSLGNALEVEYNPSLSSPCQLHIPDVQVPGYDMLGARWNSSDITAASNHAFICGINQDGGTSTSRPGPQMTVLWHVSLMPSEATQLLRVSASNGTGSLLTRCHQNDTGYIWFRPTSFSSGSEVDVDLFFEPI